MTAIDPKDLITSHISPFLLIDTEKYSDKRHFVIDTCYKATLDIDDDGQITQTFTWGGHEASEEEIEKFLGEEDK